MKPRPDWTYNVKEGDILYSPLEGYRIVRGVTYKKGELCCVAFVKKRASWTGRLYTVLSYYDLKYRKFQPTRCRASLKSEFDKALKFEIDNRMRSRMRFGETRGKI